MGSKSATVKPVWPKFMKKQMRGIARSAESLYNDPSKDALPDLNPWTTQALGNRAQMAQSGNTVGAASGAEAMKILRGEYLDPTQNPNFQRAMGAAMGAASDRFAGSGRVGSGAYAGALGDAATGVAGQMYDAERQRMLGTLSLSPQLVAAQYADTAALEDSGRAMDEDAMARFDWPYARLDRYANTVYGSPMAQTPGQNTRQPFSGGAFMAGMFNPLGGQSQGAGF